MLKTLAGNSDINIRGFVGGESPDYPTSKYAGDRQNQDVFANLRAQYYWLLRDRFENTHKAVNGDYHDPDALISLSSNLKDLKLLKSELCRIQRKRGNFRNTHIQIESKVDMKKRGLHSPGLADALVYAFANKEKKNDKPLDYSKQDRRFRR